MQFGTLVVLLAPILLANTSARKKKAKSEEECIVVFGTEEDALIQGSAYVEAGRFSIQDEVDISMDVLPDRTAHNGILFSIGTEGFHYYERANRAPSTQFLVLEIVYSSLSLVLKSEGTLYLEQLEVFRTFPTPYYLNNGKWRHIHVVRDSLANTWKLTLDNLTVSRPNDDATNVRLQDEMAHIGGRPEYKENQFNGVIANLVVNGQRLQLGTNPNHGDAEVWHCSAPLVRDAIAEIQKDPNARPEERKWWMKADEN